MIRLLLEHGGRRIARKGDGDRGGEGAPATATIKVTARGPNGEEPKEPLFQVHARSPEAAKHHYGLTEIGSPVVKNPTGIIVMNIPSLERYESLVRSGGYLVVNTSLVDRNPEREDIEVILVPAVEIAEELGDKRLANLVLLGALVDRMGPLTIEQIGDSLGRHIPEHRRNLLEANLKALARGAEIARAQLETA